MQFLDSVAPFAFLVVLAALTFVALRRGHDVAWTPIVRHASTTSFELTTDAAVATVVETHSAFGTPVFATLHYRLAEDWNFDLCLRRWPYNRYGFPTGFDDVDCRFRIHADSERLIDALQADAGLRAQLIFIDPMLRRLGSRLYVINAAGRRLKVHYKLPWRRDRRELHREVVDWSMAFDRMLRRM